MHHIWFLSCYFLSIFGMLMADHAKCPPNWVSKNIKNAHFCYTTVKFVPSADKKPLKNDICKRKANPASRVASIHSNAENEFLLTRFPGAMIGLHIPKSAKWGVSNFRWSDGTKTNFHGWDINGTPKQPDNQFPIEGFVKLRQKYNSKGWHDYQLHEMDTVLCKMKASVIKNETKDDKAITSTPLHTLESSKSASTSTIMKATTTATTNTIVASTTTTVIPNTSAKSTQEMTLSSTEPKTTSQSAVEPTQILTSPPPTTTITEFTKSHSTTTTATDSITSPTTTATVATTSTKLPTTTSAVDDGGIVILDGAKP